MYVCKMVKIKIPKIWNTPLCSPNFKAMQDNKGPATIVQIIGFLFIIFLFVYYWIADYGKPGIMEQVIDSENTTNSGRIIEFFQWLFQLWPPWLVNFIADLVLYGFLSLMVGGFFTMLLTKVILVILPKDEEGGQAILDKNINKPQASDNIASLKKRILHPIIEGIISFFFYLLIIIIGGPPEAAVLYILLSFFSEVFFNRSIPHFITNTRIIFLKTEDGWLSLFTENPSDMGLWLKIRWLLFRFFMKGVTFAFFPISIFLILYYKITPYDYLTETRVVDNK